MQSKSLLIAIAAFAVTATGVHAYGGTKVLNRVGLNKDQIEALRYAHELKAMGDHTAARDHLLAANINEETLHAMQQATKISRMAIHEALEANDYEAFKIAIADSPLADIITTKADFLQFKAAHELRERKERGMSYEAGQRIESHTARLHRYEDMKQKSSTWFDFSDEQRAALQVARQGNDRGTIQAIFDEAGVEYQPHMKR